MTHVGIEFDYPLIWEFLRHHGQWYKPRPWAGKKMQKGKCFFNSKIQTYLLRNMHYDERFHYVEGLAIHGNQVVGGLHAWVGCWSSINGAVAIDPTWDEANVLPCKFIGVSLPLNFVIKLNVDQHRRYRETHGKEKPGGFTALTYGPLLKGFLPLPTVQREDMFWRYPEHNFGPSPYPFEEV